MSGFSGQNGGFIQIFAALPEKGAQNSAAEQQQDQQIADLQNQQAQPQYAPPPPAPAAPAVGGTDMVTQLENLKKLLDEGVLTQAEFDMQKQKLLSAS